MGPVLSFLLDLFLEALGIPVKRKPPPRRVASPPVPPPQPNSQAEPLATGERGWLGDLAEQLAAPIPREEIPPGGVLVFDGDSPLPEYGYEEPAADSPYIAKNLPAPPPPVPSLLALPAKAPQPGSNLGETLRDPARVRQAILLAEILAPPLGLRGEAGGAK
ncbi:MAG: hypothetical protein LBU79_00625 [Planctomycetota bacterium]|jgi:hypothetical protein|nr:hypothetical protein [Planctomycetota bacterium]